jgi:hypothetical protein
MDQWLKFDFEWERSDGGDLRRRKFSLPELEAERVLCERNGVFVLWIREWPGECEEDEEGDEELGFFFFIIIIINVGVRQLVRTSTNPTGFEANNYINLQ